MDWEMLKPVTHLNAGKHRKPVFFDPTHHRWIGFVILASISIFFLTILAITLLIRIYNGPEFPTFTLDFPGERFVAQEIKTSTRDQISREPRNKFHMRKTRPIRENPLSNISNGLSALAELFVSRAHAAEVRLDLEPEVFAFFVNWDPASINSLNENIGAIDVLIPEWLHLADEAGAITLNDPPSTQAVIELTAARKPDLKIIPLINNFTSGTRQDEWINNLLGNSESRTTLVTNLLDYVRSNNFAGITIDFQTIGLGKNIGFTQFSRELYEAFQQHNLGVYHTLPIDDPSRPAADIARFADGIILFSYGENDPSTPGPLASQDWFERNLLARFLEVPASKLIVGLINTATDWTKDNPVSQSYTVQEAFTRARQAGAHFSLDPKSLNPTFSYFSENNVAHKVWLLDSVASYNQLKGAMSFRPHGVALWRLGSEDPCIWKLLADPDQINPDDLRKIAYTFQIDRYGNGEVHQLTNLPQSGLRNIQLAKDNRLIVAEDIEYFPRSFEIMQWGARKEKLLALTFDDGPDPKWSPQILDVLARNNVPATFFSTGANMLKNPKIVRRMLDEGHDMGNHTYFHPNIANINKDLLRLELNATQRIFESITGRNLVLFRAPYAQNAYPLSPQDIWPLATISEMGYFSVYMNIHSRDWELSDAREISDRIDSAVHNSRGNIILLHDSGGDRSQTIIAIQTLIDHLRAEGFRFVTVSELLGKTRNETMPLIRQINAPVQFIQSLSFTFIREIERWSFLLFSITIILGIGRSVVVLILSIARRKHRTHTISPKLSVGIVVPAFNEEKVILNTVRSLLRSTYHDLQILIIDDGSTDRTHSVCKAAFASNPKVKIVKRKNSGKSEALNFGFNMLDTDIVVALDADTIFLPETVTRLVRNFDDKNIAAVSGNAKVGNRVNILTKWQALEYITAQNLDRRAAELLNCIPVVPGAIGAWRRETVLEAGGFTLDTLAEDADLTLRLIRNGHMITYDEDAIALTEAPEAIRQFMKQRFRWMFGMMQVAFKHMDAFALKDSKTVGLIALPNILLFQIFFPLLAPIIDLFALVTIINVTWTALSNSVDINYQGSVLILSMFFIFILVDFISAAAAFWFEKREDKRLLLWLVPQRFFYRQLIYIVAIKAVLVAIRGSTVGWGTLKRSASVHQQSRPSGRNKPIS